MFLFSISVCLVFVIHIQLACSAVNDTVEQAEGTGVDQREQDVLDQKVNNAPDERLSAQWKQMYLEGRLPGTDRAEEREREGEERRRLDDPMFAEYKEQLELTQKINKIQRTGKGDLADHVWAWASGKLCSHGTPFVDKMGKKKCNCSSLFRGPTCNRPICLRGTSRTLIVTSCVCGPNYSGQHCEKVNCHHGRRNSDNQTCTCLDDYTGPFCDQRPPCFNGRRRDGHCICNSGYTGRACDRCVNCGSRRPAMRSRFALSGLSLCLITIILLWMSVVTRRRRAMLAAQQLERLSVERNNRPTQTRDRRLHQMEQGVEQGEERIGGHGGMTPSGYLPSPFYPYAPLPAPLDAHEGSNLLPDAPPSYEEAVGSTHVVK